MFIGIAGGAFNQSREQEMGFGSEMKMGPYRLVCQSFTQDSNPTFDTEYALLDVYKGGRKVTQMAPEKRFLPGEPDECDGGGEPFDLGGATCM